MNRIKLISYFSTPLALFLAVAPVSVMAQAEFDETKVLIEINASDGDIGFHAKYDADAWWKVFMFAPNGKKILKEMASGPLREQGVTENFFESAEPLCAEGDDPDELVVTLAEFLDRFPDGDYLLYGENNEGEELIGSAELTYNLPAAPDISAMLDEDDEPVEFGAGDPVVIEWAEGDDLGECDFGDLIPDPGSVEEVAWEAVVEPECEGVEIEFERKFTAQLPPGETSVTVSPEFMAGYTSIGCFEFKFEVGAIEESGNQTFSEGEFTVEE